MIVRLSEVPIEERHLLSIADLEQLVRLDRHRPEATGRRRPRRRVRFLAAAPAAPASTPIKAPVCS